MITPKFVKKKKPKLLGLIGWAALFGLACGAGNMSQFLSPLPTPTQPALAIEVTVVKLPTRPTAISTQTPASMAPTIALLLVEGGGQLPTLIPTDTPIATATPTAPPTAPPPVTPDAAAPTAIAATQPAGDAPAAESSELLPDGSITLIELPNNFTLPNDVSRVEFKWVWNEASVCAAPPDGQGFDIRVWPDLPGYGPMGVDDVNQLQEKIFCDPKSGTRGFEVGHIRNTPGVQATGTGQFRWQIALVELAEPFTPLAVSESRVFQLPPDPTTPTPTLTPESRVTQTCPCDEVGGEIILIEPQHEVEVPPADKTFEVKWRWSGADGCQLPPAGYGFEVRIWPEHPGYGPMGAMGDAKESQKDIFCDAGNNVRSYLVQNFHGAPGVRPAGAGRFYWDVILFKAEPYSEIIKSETRIFTLPGVSKLEQ